MTIFFKGGGNQLKPAHDQQPCFKTYLTSIWLFAAKFALHQPDINICLNHIQLAKGVILQSFIVTQKLTKLDFHNSMTFEFMVIKVALKRPLKIISIYRPPKQIT